MRLSEKLINLRKERNLTQEEFAEILQVSRQTVSNWETKKFYPDLETLVLISNKFNISLDVLLKDDKDMIKKLDNRLSRDAKRIIFILIAIISLFIFSMLGLLMLDKYNTKQDVIKLQEIKNDLKNTSKIIIGNKYLKDSKENITLNKITYGVVTEITDQNKIEEFITILDNIEYRKNNSVNDNKPYFILKLFDKTDNLIKTFTFSYDNFELINNMEKIYLNYVAASKLENLLKDYMVPISKYDKNLTDKLLNTKSIVVRKYINNDYIKTIKDEEIINEIIHIVINSAIREGEILTKGLNYTLEYLDSNDKVIAKSIFDEDLYLNGKCLTKFDYSKLKDLVENN